MHSGKAALECWFSTDLIVGKMVLIYKSEQLNPNKINALLLVLVLVQNLV